MKFQSINFTCEGCGAPLRYSPMTNSLRCEFCSGTEDIPLSSETIEEYDFHKALRFLETHRAKEITKKVKCSKCAVTFKLTPYSISSNCPYCDTPAITNFVKDITPKSILPFTITDNEATRRFKKWIGSLWFAPNKLKEFVDGDRKLVGYYLPHWTYDSQTYSRYRGKRGVVYYVTVERTVIVNGRQQRVSKREARIRWTPVEGAVSNSFDDITVGASKTISHAILDNLSPWDTSRLLPFDEKYLSGFESEEYTIGLDNGFEFAKMKMDRVIRRDIKRDIGGDQQQISSVDTRHSDTTYKNALFPVWIAKFKWKDKIYNYAINGQSGEVVGERPYSVVKIIVLVGFILALLGIGFYLEEYPHLIEDIFAWNP
ncbi:primosomal protein N' (replication factor Y) - superfamily II helicase [Sulfurovum sp. bin170]|uniref:primosomal protein N' (replication factor Y) - superfamily II helicase n=1 Tax=Sulfurovum sp. bin170 TaxID=2695268 RepID=UPI0013DF0FBD|nr:primosomal protein N' (replication factor Y) - superfamily II helicase [Sulfurovum sp. bin170]NEW59793.1 primosomal protein N' (replication factor Y) - superfamily II helicase [Sulfurovum sp. bin170]